MPCSYLNGERLAGCQVPDDQRHLVAARACVLVHQRVTAGTRRPGGKVMRQIGPGQGVTVTETHVHLCVIGQGQAGRVGQREGHGHCRDDNREHFVKNDVTDIVSDVL